MKKLRTNRSNTGKLSEKLVEMIIIQYHRGGFARIKKVDPPVRMIGRRVIFLQNPFLDYCGVCTADGGRAIFFEVKSTSEPKIGLGKSNTLTGAQIDSLNAWWNAGAMVGVIWDYKGVLKFISLALIADTLAGGVKHIKWENAETILPGIGLLQFDFLTNLRSHARK